MQKQKGLLSVLYWLLTRQPPKWPAHIHVEPQKVGHQRIDGDQIWVTFINHSTVLIQTNGLNILTDPIWSERASPFKWMGPRRIGAPGIQFEDLPPIDLVLISHNHYDHMDIPTLQRLEKRDHPHFVVSRGNKNFLKTKGLSHVDELDWWQSLKLSSDLNLFFVPSRHFSSRSLWDRNKTQWGGFAIKTPNHLVYFAGDTGYGPHFKQIRERLGKPAFSILPIGAFKPEWVMNPVHLSPSQAVQAYKDLESEKAMAIHFGTFQMSDEGYTDAVEGLKKALNENGLTLDQFWVLRPGEGRKVK